MGRLLLLVALCVLPALATAARPTKNPFLVQGRVYCDTCRAGFETPKTFYIDGAKVKVECKDRKTMDLVYSREGTTDASGTYSIHVDEDHRDQLCDAILLSSPRANCNTPSEGRDRTRVILTSFNGIATNTRYANAMGFDIDQPLSGCTKLLQMYQPNED